MKRIMKYIPVLLLMPLLLASCTGEKIRTKEANGKPGVVSFSLTSHLRASGDENIVHPTPALDREKKVEKLYAVVFNTSSGLFHKTVECTKAAGDNYEFDNEKSGDFYFFLIANPDANLVNAMKAGLSTPEDLGQLIAKQTPGEDANATNFLMTSDRVNVTVQSKQATTIANPIKLIRVAARFDFYNKIEGLVINKITFNKRYTSTHLFAQVKHMDDLTSTTDKTYDGSLFQGSALTGAIYGYETDTRGETYFTIEATYKGKPLKPEEVRLENFVIKRNHLYNIILHDVGGAVDPNTPGSEFGKLKYEIKVADWEPSDRLGVTEGELFNTYMYYSGALPKAPYLNPFLINSPKTIYTTTKEATEVVLSLETYVKEGSLKLKDGQTLPAGVTLTEFGASEKNPQTGKITKKYKLTLPQMDDFLTLDLKNGGELIPPEFVTILLEASNYTRETVKVFSVRHGRFKLPLEYFSEKPLNKTFNGFAADPSDTNEVGYADVDADTGIVPRLLKMKIDGVDYHLPTSSLELLSIVPKNYNTTRALVGQGKNVLPRIDNVEEIMTLPNWAALPLSTPAKIQTYADYQTDKSKRVTYAIRYKKGSLGSLLQTAFKYEWIGEFREIDTEGKIPSYFKITCRYLGPNWDGSVSNIANDDFWNNNNEQDVVRILYALGRLNGYKANAGKNPREYGTSVFTPTPEQGGYKNWYLTNLYLQPQKWVCNEQHICINKIPVFLFSNK